MNNPTRQILRSFNRKDINIGCWHTHERVQNLIAKVPNTQFYAFHKHGATKPWNFEYGKQPLNYHDLGNTLQMPLWLDGELDLFMVQTLFGQYQLYKQYFSNITGLRLEHTCSMPWWDKKTRDQLKQCRLPINVFITKWSLESWEWEDYGDTYVIEHCVDSDLFKPDPNTKRKNHILTIANDFKGRDQVLNFQQYLRITEGLPTYPIGATPGFSEPAKDLDHLVKIYQSSKILLSTAHLSPMPTNLLEGMATGCACISVNACAVSDYIKDGETGLLYTNENEAKEKLRLLLNDDDLATKLGNNARNFVKERCKISRFVEQWQNVFEKAANIRR